MTKRGKCDHHNWHSMFDSEGFMYEEVCSSCGQRRPASRPYGDPYLEREAKEDD